MENDGNTITSKLVFQAWCECTRREFELATNLLNFGDLSWIGTQLEREPNGSWATSVLLSTAVILAFRSEDPRLLDRICSELESALTLMSDTNARIHSWNGLFNMTTSFLEDGTSWPYAVKLRDALIEMRDRILD